MCRCTHNLRALFTKKYLHIPKMRYIITSQQLKAKPEKSGDAKLQGLNFVEIASCLNN